MIQVVGYADLRHDRYSLKAHVNNSPLELISIGEQGYMRVGSRAWCSVDVEDPAAQLGVAPTSVLGSLEHSGGALRRVDTRVLRGVATTHYEIARGSLSDEVWVDKDDLLRRFTGERDGERITLDFYDFGVAITPITAPLGAGACSTFPFSP